MKKTVFTIICGFSLLSTPLALSGTSGITDANGAVRLTPSLEATALLSGASCMAYKVSNKPVLVPHHKCRFS